TTITTDNSIDIGPLTDSLANMNISDDDRKSITDLFRQAMASQQTTSALKRARRHRQQSIRLMSYSTAYKNSRRLLTFIGAVNNRPAKILIDGGAEGNVISSKLCSENAIPLKDSVPIPIVLPNGSASLAHHIADFTLERDAVSAIVYPLKKYDLILGKPWLTDMNPHIEWRSSELHFTYNGIFVRWTCTEFASSSPPNSITMSALHFVATAADPNASVFLAQVKLPTPTTTNEPELPNAVRHLVKVEFPDVFPPELPVMASDFSFF
ncbi:hypothetical protein BGX28_001118, partial [Mortierella sp. GBA30]